MQKLKPGTLPAFFTLLFSTFFIISYAQKKTTDYNSSWKKIDQLINKGLTKSALEEVETVYQLAKKDRNDAQVIKALLFELNLNQNLQEDANVNNIKTIEKEITGSKEPERSILYSISAQMYWDFFQQNRYKLYDRTNTAPIAIGIKKDDIETWSADDLHKKISELYLASIKEENALKQTKLEPFEPIIIKGNVRYLRPTLFDLLAYRALDYFKNDERDISRPAYAFEIKDEKAFSPASEFISHKFINKDSSSLHFKALTIFQKLLAFHLQDAKPDALIDADIERLEFVKQYGVMDNIDDLYIKALQTISSSYENNPASAQAGYLIAIEIYNKATAEKAGTDTLQKYFIKQAKEMADALIKKYPESEGGINAKNLLNQILFKELSLESEKVNIPDQPFRTLVSYKNFSSLYLRIIEITPEFKKLIERNYDNDLLWKNITSAKFIRSWEQSLPVTDDYKTHSVEIKIDGLPVGQYALLASTAEKFSLNKNPLAVQYFHVSGISYINNSTEYFVLNRQTGKPLAAAKVQVWNQRYDYNTNKNILEKQELLIADKNGYFKITEPKQDVKGKILPPENRSLRLEITFENDKLFLDDYQNTYQYYNDGDSDADEYNATDVKNVKDYEQEKAKIFLFTDRSIYRPGQLVYFKGIGVTKDLKTHKSKLLSGEDSLTVILTDANAQKVDSINVLLNEYGSLNGQFRLPENKLNGEFKIAVSDYKNASVLFSVEEYKRPKFYTEFEKVKGTYRVNDTIKIIGSAKAYAGNNVDGAKVKYRVTRVARFLYPWMFWRWPMPVTRPLEITHGELNTDAEGKFSIEFEAIPDLSIDKKTDPVFDYKVEADVTDINGETRSASETVPVGYKALELQITLPQQDAISIDSLNNISVSSKNLNGEFEATKVNVKIYKLKTPERLIRTRYWEQPDKFVMSKEEYLKYFRNDEYKDESKKETWQREELVFELSDSTKPTGNWQLATGKFSQGWYVAEATAKDKYGQEVKDVKYFQLYDLKGDSLPSLSYSWNGIIKNSAEPGDKIQFISGTSANDLFVIQQTDKNKSDNKGTSVTSYAYYSLSNEKKTFEIPVTEDDRGGFGVYQFFVKDNRVYTNNLNAIVPWSNKQLDITYETFRDKTLPGSEEKWKVKISGTKGEKVAAEMLTSMYDASLDQFKEHNWRTPDIWPTYTGYNEWASVQNFTSVQSIEKWHEQDYVQQKEKRYDELIYAEDGNRIFNTNIKMLSNSVALDVKTLNMSRRESVEQAEDKTLGRYFDRLAVPMYDSVGNIVGQTTQQEKRSDNIDQSQIQIRKNFNETVFFFPELRTDKDGNVEFNFTMPEALTKWKLMTLVHTKDLATGYAEKTVVAQKELMVQPFAPRFLREGDKMEFTAKISNLASKEITGQAELQLLNASTMAAIDGWFKNVFPVQHFTAGANQSTVVKFTIEIPYNYNNALVYRIVAKASAIGGGLEGASDGEETAIPVLTNRMLVTETMPLPVRGDTTKNFTFEKLINSGKSETLSNHALTVEYTSNPAWYAVQALPYLMEYPYPCSEQTFNRYYANSIAAKIVSSSPKIKAVFDKWASPLSGRRGAGGEADTSALLSNLQKNEELKSVLLEETPWVLQAQTEQEQKKNIALLFDIVRMSKEMGSALNELKDMQSSNGGFVWFKGGPDDRYITQYIITGIGHLKKLGAFSVQNEELNGIIKAALPYLDKKLKEDYDNLKKYKVNLKNNNLNNIVIQYLYMRSFFPEYSIPKEIQTAYTYYSDQSKKYWLSRGKYMQAMIALFLHRTNDKTTPQAIIRSLKENAINNEELGMYWKEWDVKGYWWHQAPIESQGIMIEAFNDIDKDAKVINDLKTWLLKNKQTNNWRTTKATADACYAMLLHGTEPITTGWLDEEKTVSIKLGSTTINNNDVKEEEGTGYFKTKIDGDKVKPEMGNISVTVSTIKNPSKASPKGEGLEGASWGAAYWQYIEDLDKIAIGTETPLKLNKKLFIENNTDRGPVLTPLSQGEGLGGEAKVGDKIKVRIELRVDRDMEYIHMKDMRASCMEPVNVISQYKYQGGLGYYETTKDASTNFFFNYLPKGTYVFEYPLFVTHSGNFTNGITTIQCMYAPEFTSHSEGVRVNVTE